MGKRFLNDKTKEVFIGHNTQDKVRQILKKYLPHQKVLIVTTSSFVRNKKNYYNNFIKSIKCPFKDFLFNKKVKGNKIELNEIIKEATEEVASIVVIGDEPLINLAKISAHIRNIPYIIVPTNMTMPSYLYKNASLINKGLRQFYITNAPLALYVEEDLAINSNKRYILNAFAEIIMLRCYLLDEFLSNACSSITSKNKHMRELEKIINEALISNYELYNYNKSNLISLINQTIKCGLIMQSFNKFNIDSVNLCATAFEYFEDNKKMKPAYYRIISSLFLLNLFESFVSSLKLKNYTAVNIKNRLQAVRGILNDDQIYNNMISQLSKSSKNEMLAYYIIEFKQEMLQEIKKTKIIISKGYKIIKRMDLDLSFYIENNLKVNNVKKSICLAPDLGASQTFIKIMRNFGVLDYNF